MWLPGKSTADRRMRANEKTADLSMQFKRKQHYVERTWQSHLLSLEYDVLLSGSLTKDNGPCNISVKPALARVKSG